MATPVFDGAAKKNCSGSGLNTPSGRLKLVNPNGKASLFDGRTGEPIPVRSQWATSTS